MNVGQSVKSSFCPAYLEPLGSTFSNGANFAVVGSDWLVGQNGFGSEWNFEAFVAGHLRSHALDILTACEAYMNGLRVGCVVSNNERCCSVEFQKDVASCIMRLVYDFKAIGATEADNFIHLTLLAPALFDEKAFNDVDKRLNMAANHDMRSKCEIKFLPGLFGAIGFHIFKWSQLCCGGIFNTSYVFTLPFLCSGYAQTFTFNVQVGSDWLVGQNGFGSEWNFEAFVAGHLRSHALDILTACEAYMNGLRVGCVVSNNESCCSVEFQKDVASCIMRLVYDFKAIGATVADNFIHLTLLAPMKLSEILQTPPVSEDASMITNINVTFGTNMVYI
ncbi:hypothetical protein SSX86_019557 [Deinandra increscens subsp. villosa]|uniref:Uncharacterized protein n=1 Tax=Deinandra increscens subsp. villosa TaxID=3103831 RepID=A0AAP0GUP5_9ASTR